MNTKKVVKKLSLSKKTIANLSQNTMNEAKGGIPTIVPIPPNTDEHTICFCSWVYSCDVATCSPSWCGLQCR